MSFFKKLFKRSNDSKEQAPKKNYRSNRVVITPLHAVTLNLKKGDFSMEFEIKNIGSLELEIIDISSDNSAFRANPTNSIIGVGSSKLFDAQFSPDDVGTFTGRLTIMSNDPTDENIFIVGPPGPRSHQQSGAN